MNFLLYILLQTGVESQWFDLASKLTVTGGLIIAVVYFQKQNAAIAAKYEQALKDKQTEVEKLRIDSRREIDDIRTQYEDKIEKVLDKQVALTDRAMQTLTDGAATNRDLIGKISELITSNRGLVDLIKDFPKQTKP